jgi:hypothetical protein
MAFFTGCGVDYFLCGGDVGFMGGYFSDELLLGGKIIGIRNFNKRKKLP